jgi:ribosome-binding ATPase YchF (GTP1/OBG family)
MKVVLSSALAEIFLRKMQKDGFIKYIEGSDTITTAEDDPSLNLKPLDEKTKARLEKVKDLVLFRYGSTGIQDAISKAVETKELIPVYPVKSIHNFTSDG